MTSSLKVLTAFALVVLASPAFARGGGGMGHGMDHDMSHTTTMNKTVEQQKTPTHANREVTAKITKEARILLAQFLADVKSGNVAGARAAVTQLRALGQIAARDGIQVTVHDGVAFVTIGNGKPIMIENV
jgi:hypothetical protein